MATGKELKNAIKGKGLTFEVAAHLLGISRQTLHTYLSKDKIDKSFIQKVKDALDITLSESKEEVKPDQASDTISQLVKIISQHAEIIKSQHHVIRKYIEKEAPDIIEDPKNVSTLSKLKSFKRAQ